MSDNKGYQKPAPDISQRIGLGAPGGGRAGMNRAENLIAEKPKNAKGTIFRLFTYVKFVKWPMLFALILALVHTAANLATTYMVRPAINNYIVPKNYSGLVVLCLTLGVIYLISFLGQLISQRILITVSQKVSSIIRKQLFTKIETLPVSYFDNHHFGDIMSRFTNDLENVSLALKDTLVSLLEAIFNTFGTLAFMLIISWKLTIISLCSLPVIIFFTKFVTSKTKKYYKQFQYDLGMLNAYAEERISGQYAVLIFNQGDNTSAEFDSYAAKVEHSGSKSQFFSGMTMPCLRGINSVFYAITALVAGLLSVSGELLIGDIVAFMKYSRQFGNPINEIASQITSLMAAVAGAERIFEVLDEKGEYEKEPQSIALENIKGDISIKNMFFSYTKDKQILKDISVDVKSGQHIALVGPTGAGKTTIANILMRFYDFDSGEISIDDIPITNIKKHSLRSNFGIVLQDTNLFTVSVKDNIRFGKEDASDEEVIAASKLSGADKFIRQLPEGYDTILEDGGNGLSGGQRQLLNITRAFLIDPPMLILDEATSNVDTRTELQIQRAMKTLMKGKTAFLIAHRLSTIRDCDMILVIDGGKIVERGTAEQLIEQNGLYAKLYRGVYEDN